MPPVRHTASSPLTRNQLLALNQYVASPSFPTLGRWDRSRFDDLYVVRGSVARTEPVDLTVVCKLSSDHHYLQPHGNYNSMYLQTADMIGRKAKLLFTVQRPSADPDLSGDYNVTLNRLNGLQVEVSRSDVHKNFISGDQLWLNFNLFEPKSNDGEPPADAAPSTLSDTKDSGNKKAPAPSPGNDSIQCDETDEEMDSDLPPLIPYDDYSEEYEVLSEHRDMWRETEKYYTNRIMPVYGVNKSLVPYTHFPRVLKPGTTIIVCFNLKHYAFKDEKKEKYIFDSYTAAVTQIVILALPDLAPSKPLATPVRKKKFTSQTPSRSTLKIAANAFSPAPSAASTPTKNRGDRVRATSNGGTGSTSLTYSRTSSGSADGIVHKSDAEQQQFGMGPLYPVSSSVLETAVPKALLRALLPVIVDYMRTSSSSRDDPAAASSPIGSRPTNDGVNPGDVAPLVVASSGGDDDVSSASSTLSYASTAEDGEIEEDKYVAVEHETRESSVPTEAPKEIEPPVTNTKPAVERRETRKRK